MTKRKEKTILTGAALLEALTAEDSGPFSISLEAVTQALAILGAVVADVSTGPVDLITLHLRRVNEFASIIAGHEMCMGDEKAEQELDHILTGTTPAMAMFFVAVRLLNDAQYEAWHAATHDEFRALDMLREYAAQNAKERRKANDKAEETLRDLLARVSVPGND